MLFPSTAVAPSLAELLNFELWQLASRWLHLLAMGYALGGSLFTFLVLQPSAGELPEEPHQQLRAAVRGRLAKFVHASIALLLVTGLVNYILAVIPQLREYKAEVGGASLYHPLFGVKFLLALFVFFSQSLLVGRSGLAQSWQANARRWVGVNIAVMLLILLLSGYLLLSRQGHLRERLDRALATPMAVQSVDVPCPHTVISAK